MILFFWCHEQVISLRMIALMEWVNGPKIIYLFRTLSMYIHPFIQFTNGYRKLEFHLSCCELVNHQFLKTWIVWISKNASDTFWYIPCWAALNFWKMDFDELHFWSLSNLNFAGYTGSRNQVWNRSKIKFIKLQNLNSIFQNSGTDRQGKYYLEKLCT